MINKIKDILPILSKTDRQNFIDHLNKLNKIKNPKNIKLFKLLLTNKENELKLEMGSNAYNVLNKRLTDSFLDFISNLIFEAEASKEIKIMKHIFLSRKLFTHSNHKIAFKLLSSIEKEAINLDDPVLLNEIYHTLIQYSHLDSAPEQHLIFEKFKTNQLNLLQTEQLNMAYAVIRKTFKSNEQSTDTIDLNTLVNTTFKTYDVKIEESINYKSLYQLAEILDLNSSNHKNYHTVDLFFIDKLDNINLDNKETSKHQIYHIDLLYIIANIYFRQRNFELSAFYLNKMHIEMERFDRAYYKSRIIKHNTLLALVLNYNGDHSKALSILENLISTFGFNQKELPLPTLVKIMIHFQQNQLIEANKLLIKLNQTDNWYIKNIGLEWVLNKKYIEILLHIEMGNIDFVDSRIQSLTRKYSNYFKFTNHFQVLPFLKLVKQYYHTPHIINTKEFKKTVEVSLKWKPNNEEDVFLISFYAWLKSKMDNEPLYETTLAIINSKT
jgi:hypothetical protein